ncbi:hypothetical protein GF380_00150 [Candidatus Uhrbacteria bacterium]|nr:hypothetical protein [Candidatus Uhrbacteria bacterium]MBD3283835.1 hypothetical protein [Candidatus Uhrbacteria bacterium]
MTYMWALYAREVKRFQKLLIDTLLSPIIQMVLFLTVFGITLQGQDVEGIPFVTFVFAGLLMMIMVNSSFSNPTFALILGKNVGTIIDLQLAPIKPGSIGLAYALAAFSRGLLTILVAMLITVWFVPEFTISNPFLMLVALLLTGIQFGLLGVTFGMIAKNFESLTIVMGFVLQPMIFLAGIFYPIASLPAPFDLISRFNPLHHNINLFRYTTLGYADTHPMLSLAVIAGITIVMYFVVQRVTRTALRKSYS